jgi:diguanylate cyclase
VRYEHSIERSTECLRAALPLMSRQGAGLHPVSYAVWYEYVSGDNAPLRQAVDEQLNRRSSLDEQSTQALFARHVAEVDPATAQRVSDGFTRVLSGMAESAALAGDQTARFGDSLSRLSANLQDQGPAPVLLALQDSTRDMQSAVSRLQERLAESQREIQQLRDEVRRARHDSLVDSLTGLANRRAFDERMAQCLDTVPAPAGSSAPPDTCLLMADIDHFKRINDTYGHAFGDQVIKAVGQVLRQMAPDAGLAARIGGEEFALLLPATSVEQARELAEQVRGRIAASRIRRQGQNGAIEHITVSLGLTPWHPGDSVASVFDRADQALYRSKSDGRDRVTVLAA